MLLDELVQGRLHASEHVLLLVDDLLLQGTRWSAGTAAFRIAVGALVEGEIALVMLVVHVATQDHALDLEKRLALVVEPCTPSRQVCLGCLLVCCSPGAGRLLRRWRGAAA